MKGERVVVTGIGAVTPLGATFSESVNALVRGYCGISSGNAEMLKGLRCRSVAPVKEFDPSCRLSQKEIKRVGVFVQYAISSVEEALQDAGLSCPAMDTYIVAGTSRAGILEIEKILINGGMPTGYTMVATMASMLSSSIVSKYKINTEAITLSGACASGAMAIGQAYRVLKEGKATMAICGGSEAPLTRFSLYGYEKMGVLSALPPEKAQRPFDFNRDGFVLGEGATFLVLETLSSALKRNAKIYAEIVSYAYVVSSHNQVSPSKEAEVCAIKKALEEAKLSCQEIEHINLHGTATRLGDKVEAEAIKEVFGQRAWTIPATAIKASTGHMLSGSSAFEAAVTAWSLASSTVPPSIRSEQLEFSFNLSTKARNIPIHTAMNLSFGFGGVNVVLVFRRFTD